MIRALFVSLAVGSCAAVQAAPLLYFTLEGRRQGTADVFSSSVDVALGDIVEYRLQMRLAPPETENLHLTERLASPTREHRRLPDKNGANSLSVSIFQDPSDRIQVDLSSPVQLNNETGPTINDGWGRSNFARAGQPIPRADSPFNDLIGIRPIQPPGVFVGSAVDETVFSGELVVAGLDGDLGTLRPKWGPTAGGLSFYGDGFFPKYERRDEFNWERGTEDSPDPLTHFTPLTLTASKAAVPEPSTLALVGTAVIGLTLFRRRRQLAKQVVAVLFISTACGTLQAAPLVYFALEGRAFGSDDPFASQIDVQLGDTVEYRLLARMAPFGTLNQFIHPDGPRPDGTHGLNSLSISITQDSTVPIQVDLNSPVVLSGPSSPTANDSWGFTWVPNRGAHAKPGIPTLRPGSDFNDLLAIRPMRPPGVFAASDNEIVFTGSFDVAAISGAVGNVNAQWGPTTGGGRFFGSTFFPASPGTSARDTENTADPLTHFTPLTLTASGFEVVPEPSTLALFGITVVALIVWRRPSRILKQVVAAVFVLCAGSSLQAAPLVYFALEGRTYGSGDAFTNNIDVELGDTVEYRLRASMAAEGSLNKFVSNNTPHPLFADKHGLNSLSISIGQDATDPIQVDLHSPVVLTPDRIERGDGWDRGTGADAGQTAYRPGQPWNDLLSIRPVHWPGIHTAHAEEIIFTGVFDVMSIANAPGQVDAEWGPISGAGWFHGNVFIVAPNRDDSSDPITHFTPLTLTPSNFQAVPEPSTITFLGMSLVGLALVGRRRLFTRTR